MTEKQTKRDRNPLRITALVLTAAALALAVLLAVLLATTFLETAELSPGNLFGLLLLVVIVTGAFIGLPGVGLVLLLLDLARPTDSLHSRYPTALILISVGSFLVCLSFWREELLLGLIRGVFAGNNDTRAWIGSLAFFAVLLLLTASSVLIFLSGIFFRKGRDPGRLLVIGTGGAVLYSVIFFVFKLTVLVDRMMRVADAGSELSVPEYFLYVTDGVVTLYACTALLLSGFAFNSKDNSNYNIYRKHRNPDPRRKGIEN